MSGAPVRPRLSFLQKVGSVLDLLWVFGLGLVMGLICLPLFLGPRRWALAVVRFWMRMQIAGLQLLCGVSVEVRGVEKLPAGAFILAPKHQGMLDIMPPFLYLSAPTFILKRELMSIPIFGWYAAKAGMVAIDRSGHAKTLRVMMARAKAAAADGSQIVIFPEGTRKQLGAAPDYKPGVAGIYRDLDIPCVPVATNSGVAWPPSGVWRYPARVVFEILEPIPPGLKRGEFMRRLETEIETASNRLLAE